MMDYLKKYGLTDEQINSIEGILEQINVSIDTFMFNPDKIMAILDIFKDMGVKDIYSIIAVSPAIFCDTVDSVRDRIDRFGNREELAELINDDVYNLYLVNLI